MSVHRQNCCDNGSTLPKTRFSTATALTNNSDFRFLFRSIFSICAASLRMHCVHPHQLKDPGQRFRQTNKNSETMEPCIIHVLRKTKRPTDVNRRLHKLRSTACGFQHEDLSRMEPPNSAVLHSTRCRQGTEQNNDRTTFKL